MANIELRPAPFEPGLGLLRREVRRQAGKRLGGGHDGFRRHETRDRRVVAFDDHRLAVTRDGVKDLASLSRQVGGRDDVAWIWPVRRPSSSR